MKTSPRCQSIRWSNIKRLSNHQRKLGIPITQRSAAVGAYQMLEPDIAAKALGVPLSRKFDQKTQDLLANYYLNAAGRKEFETGKISAEEYNNRLADSCITQDNIW